MPFDRSCRVYCEVVDGTVYFLDAEWDGTAALQRYMASGGGALLGAIDLLGQVGRVKIGDDKAREQIGTLTEMQKILWASRSM